MRARLPSPPHLLLLLLLLLLMAACRTSLGLRPGSMRRRGTAAFRLLATKRVVFLGTPDVAATSLQLLSDAAAAKTHDFELVAVVSQPPAPAGRNKKLTPSPVHVLAEQLKLPLLTPETAKDEAFLSQLEALQPDLCITAAYGNFLPKRFLSIPKLGTLNIHPSLLPKYRGAAPVQRCLESGDAVSGVSVAETVLKMDAGPIVRQITVPLSGDEKAPDFLQQMFKLGTSALLEALPAYFAGTGPKQAQDDSQASAAPKLSVAEARVDFARMGAREVHNKCRAFAGWPGTWTALSLGGAPAERFKIVTTVLLAPQPGSWAQGQTAAVELVKEGGGDVLRVVCGDGSVLGIAELQPPSKKAMPAKAFVNGLRGASIAWASPPESEPAPAATTA